MRAWQIWLGFLVSALFVWLTARGLEWDAFWVALRSARFWWLAPAVAVYFAAVLVRTWRWRYMLRHLRRIPLRQLFPVVVIGYMGNNVYPARAGEFIRAYVLKKRAGVSISASLGTVALERLFDGLVMCLFVFVTLPFIALPPVLRALALGLGLLFVALLALCLLLVSDPIRTERRLARIIAVSLPQRFRARAATLVNAFLVGLHVLRSPQEVLVLFASSLTIWLTEAGKYWIVSLAFPTLHIDWASVILLTAVVNLVTTLPSAPGHIGTFDKPGIEVLKLVGHPANLAAAYIIVLHIALWLPVTLLGLWFMARESLRWRELQTAQLRIERLESSTFKAQGSTFKVIRVKN